MTDSMQDIRASFFTECDELLEVLQDGLESIDAGAQDAETVNTVFRAVHSIKGGAGAFGLDDLVAFAHIFETALDALRSGRMTPGREEMRLLFAGGDLLLDLAHAARGNRPPDMARVASLTDELDRLVEIAAWLEADRAPDFTPVRVTLDLGHHPDNERGPARDGDPALSRTVTLLFRPAPQLYATGNEPVFLLRALSELGILTATCIHDPLPDIDAYDPSESLIGWTLRLETCASDEDIREVFDFVEGLCTLEIDGTKVGGAPAVPPPGPATRTAAEPPETDEPRAKATMRVDLDRIDRLVTLAGKLMINQAMLSQAAAEAGTAASVTVAAGLDEFMHLTHELRESVMMIRTQPVKPLFQRMSRIVRVASAAVGKDVRLTTRGEAIEIDRTVIERLAESLTHMIRNAVDHGLESREERVLAGKPAQGRITLSASHRSDRLVIEIRDDGRGIDRPGVRRIAGEMGLISPGQAMTDTATDALLFIPGLTTSPAVSSLSGRGVGLDVVRSAITSLGGNIVVTSHPGRGTAFTISLPLKMVVIDGMVVRAAGQSLVVPFGAIDETLSPSRGSVQTLAPGCHAIDLRGHLVPVRDLGAELGYRPPRAPADGATLLLLEQKDGSRAAFVVDAIEDRRQAVTKGFLNSDRQVPGVGATTVLGDGRIALILDPAELIASAAHHDGTVPNHRRTA